MFAQFTYSLSRYLVVADPDLVAHANASLNAANNPTSTNIKSIPANKMPPPSSNTNPTHRAAYIYDPNRVDKMYEMLAKYEENFTRHLKILLDTLNYLAATETVVFLSLCARLSSAGEGVKGFQMPTGMEGMM